MSTVAPFHADSEAESRVVNQAPVAPATGDGLLSPVGARQRIDALDVLRGFALIGILMMNIEWFERPIAYLGQFNGDLTGLDHSAGWFVHLFIDGKFYKLFSLLFGMGFAVMLMRAQEAGRKFGLVFARRMAALFVFGVAHLVLLWGGDILHDYAISGLMLLAWAWLLKRPRLQRFDNPRSIVRFSVIYMSIPFVIMTVAGIGYVLSHDTATQRAGWEERIRVAEAADRKVEQARIDGIDLTAEDEASKPGEATSAPGTEVIDEPAADPSVPASTEDTTEGHPDDATASDRTAAAEDPETFETKVDKRAKALARRSKNAEEERAAFTQPDYWTATVFRADRAVEDLKRAPIFGAILLLPIFIFGYWLIRSGRMRHPEQHRGFFHGLALIGLGLGLPMSLVAVIAFGHPAAEHAIEIEAIGGGLFQFSQFVMAAGYLGLVVGLVVSVRWRRWVMWLAPLGQMALTNYLTHSLILTTLFYGYGFAQFGQVPRARQMLMVAAIIASQWLFSTIWLRHFRFGPMEWLWRSITYWKWQPLRRAAA